MLFSGVNPIMSKFVILWIRWRERVDKIYRFHPSHFANKGSLAQRFWKIWQWLLKTEFTLVSGYQFWPFPSLVHTTSTTILLLILAFFLLLPAIPSTFIQCLLITYFPLKKKNNNTKNLSPDYLVCKCNSRLILSVKSPMITVCINHQETTFVNQLKSWCSSNLGRQVSSPRGAPSLMEVTDSEQ